MAKFIFPQMKAENYLKLKEAKIAAFQMLKAWNKIAKYPPIPQNSCPIK